MYENSLSRKADLRIAADVADKISTIEGDNFILYR